MLYPCQGYRLQSLAMVLDKKAITTTIKTIKLESTTKLPKWRISTTNITTTNISITTDIITRLLRSRMFRILVPAIILLKSKFIHQRRRSLRLMLTINTTRQSNIRNQSQSQRSNHL